LRPLNLILTKYAVRVVVRAEFKLLSTIDAVVARRLVPN
jgi:hypothetical protein